MRRAGLLVILYALASAVVADAQGIAPDDAAAQRRYTDCMQTARENPRKAEALAAAWHAEGGGPPAMHCLSVALLGLGYHEQAARNMEALGRDERSLGSRLRGDLLGQSGNAWLIAGKPEDALRALTAALAMKPDDADLLIDRGITLAGNGKYWEALDDLNRALDIAPGRIEALIFRAGAWRNVDSIELAAEDIGRALALSPDNPDALLERGLIHKARGRAQDARADWLRVIEFARDGPLADAARRNLEQMDLKAR